MYIMIYVNIGCYEENYCDQFFAAFNSACSSWQELGKLEVWKLAEKPFIVAKASMMTGRIRLQCLCIKLVYIRKWFGLVDKENVCRRVLYICHSEKALKYRGRFHLAHIASFPSPCPLHRRASVPSEPWLSKVRVHIGLPTVSSF